MNIPVKSKHNTVNLSARQTIFLFIKKKTFTIFIFNHKNKDLSLIVLRKFFACSCVKNDFLQAIFYQFINIFYGLFRIGG